MMAVQGRERASGHVWANPRSLTVMPPSRDWSDAGFLRYCAEHAEASAWPLFPDAQIARLQALAGGPVIETRPDTCGFVAVAPDAVLAAVAAARAQKRRTPMRGQA